MYIFLRTKGQETLVFLYVLRTKGSRNFYFSRITRLRIDHKTKIRGFFNSHFSRSNRWRYLDFLRIFCKDQNIWIFLRTKRTTPFIFYIYFFSRNKGPRNFELNLDFLRIFCKDKKTEFFNDQKSENRDFFKDIFLRNNEPRNVEFLRIFSRTKMRGIF